MHHHPWRAFRQLVDWTLAWAHLPGDVMGHTNFESRTITLDRRLNQHERRCTIAHEMEHARRGPVPDGHWEREEAAIDEIVARRLIPLERLADAMAVAYHEDELAYDLWVDVPTLQARLGTLTDHETDMLNARLDAAELTFPKDWC